MLKQWNEYVDGFKPASDALKKTWHPDDEGYKAMSDSIDLKLFK